MDKRISVGIHVAYKDGDQWKKGVVDSNSTFGVMMVRSVSILNTVCIAT